MIFGHLTFLSYDFKTVFLGVFFEKWHNCKMNNAILIVDDDRSQRRLIRSALQGCIPMAYVEAENGRDALRMLDHNTQNTIKLVILDLEMPVIGGLETLLSLRQTHPALPVIVLTGSNNMQDAVTAMKMGASDFLSKPVETAHLDISVRNALKLSLMGKETPAKPKERSQKLTLFSDLIGHKGGLKNKIAIGQKAASCLLPVLITGETGTGKEIFARAIHGQSIRATQKFIAVNCGAIPENLFESLLFGHEKGAYTGAINKTTGKFLEANGGTIFLDEIGDLPLDAQVKLLRVLQEKRVEPVGSNKSIPIDVRIISATNRDLANDVKSGRFREDLFFRLNVLHIDLPPLHLRTEDIPIIAGHFISKFCAVHQTNPKTLSVAAIRKLQSHGWPGNVRELENVINRAMALCDNDFLDAEHFSFTHDIKKDGAMANAHTIETLHEDGRFKSFKELEHDMILQALSYHKHNISRTAQVLGIAKSTLYAKLDKLADQKST